MTRYVDATLLKETFSELQCTGLAAIVDYFAYCESMEVWPCKPYGILSREPQAYMNRFFRQRCPDGLVAVIGDNKRTPLVWLAELAEEILRSPGQFSSDLQYLDLACKITVQRCELEADEGREEMHRVYH